MKEDRDRTKQNHVLIADIIIHLSLSYSQATSANALVNETKIRRNKLLAQHVAPSASREGTTPKLAITYSLPA